MPSLSRIFGWNPSKSEEHVNSNIPLHPTLPDASPLSIFTTSYKQVEKDQLSPAGSELVTPFSSTSSLSPDSGRPGPEPLRRGDPEWVARPRNPFIIFRCEYSREHAKEGKRVRRVPGSHAEKTLSKRAAEAWHQLSAEEKNQFKKLADEERGEHARRYPNYRFRPVKRNTGKNRFIHGQKMQPQPPKSPTSETLVRPTPQYLPPHDTSSSTSALLPNHSPPPLNMSMVKVTRRRSASAPSLPSMQPPISGFVGTELPRLNAKRSRSLMAGRTPSIQTSQVSTRMYEDLPFDPRSFDLSDSWADYSIPDSLSSEIGLVELPFNDEFSNFDSPVPLSPLSAVTSPLTSWTGESDILGNQLAPTNSPWPSSPAVGIAGEPLQQYTDYQSTDLGLARTVMNYALTNDPWTTSPSNLPAAMNVNATNVTQGALYAPMTPYDQAGHGYPLQEYGLELDMREGDTLAMPVGDEITTLDGSSYF